MNGGPQQGAVASFRVDGNVLEVTFHDAPASPLTFPLQPEWRAQRSMFDDLLGNLKRSIGPGYKADAAAAYNALRRFAIRSNFLGSQIIDGFEELSDEIRQRVLPYSLGRSPALVEALGDLDGFLPLEWLPFDRHDVRRGAPISRSDVRLLARCFLGCTAVVRREYRRVLSQERILARGMLPVRLFRDAGMQGAKDEAAFFDASEAITLVGTWPDEGVVYATDELAHWSGHANPATDTDAVQHFACHFIVKDADPGASELLFRDERTTEHRVRIDDLHYALGGTRQVAGVHPPRERPLVFVNACGTSQMTTRGVAALPRTFRDNGNLGFIGTETKVPDAFAAPFSRSFYEALVDDGDGVGLALHRARDRALVEAGNPLGLLYLFYGNPDLYFERGEDNR